MNYNSENDILEIVRAFENGTISRGNWKHAEHLTVAFYYISNNDFETSLNKMRGGIFNLLKAFEVDLNVEMPYHETLTVFWMQTVSTFAELNNGFSIVEMCNRLVDKFDKDYPLKFYSSERLFSDEARKNFVEADLKIDNKKPAVDYQSVSHQN